MNGRPYVLISIPLLFAALSSAAQLAFAAPTWQAKINVTNLGTLGGPESVALDINMYGDMVGWSHVSSGRKHAFLSWSFGPMTDISSGYTNFDTIATGINRYVDIVGTIIPPAAPVETYGFYRPLGGSMTQLEHEIDAATAEDCLYLSRAEAINDRGYIAGTIGLARDLDPDDAAECLLDRKAALWSSPVTPTLVAGSVHGPQPEFGFDLDEKQTVVGLSKATGREGVRWRTTGIRTEIPTPPPYREYVWTVSRANGISNTGWIAATYDVRISGVSTTRAIVWNGTSVNSINLEVLPSGSRSAAHDVNDLGFVVGYSNRAGHPNRAFIWHKHMGMVELPPLHTAGECQAHAINDSRRQDLQQVAGFCVNAAGNRRAVRWDVMVD